jgi:hypothetical protein
VTLLDGHLILLFWTPRPSPIRLQSLEHGVLARPRRNVVLGVGERIRLLVLLRGVMAATGRWRKVRCKRARRRLGSVAVGRVGLHGDAVGGADVEGGRHGVVLFLLGELHFWVRGIEGMIRWID